MKSLQQLNDYYYKIEQALDFLGDNFTQHPNLKDIAKQVHMSEFHFQRLFSEWVGISPKKFLQFLTKEHAKQLLSKSYNLLDTTFETGLSSPGRLHDLFISFEAVTPGEYKNSGSELIIEYGFHPSPFGNTLIAITERGICGLDFVQHDELHSLNKLYRQWPNAEFRNHPENTFEVINQIFSSENKQSGEPFHVFVKGTNFQIKVWEALLKIPYAHVISYQDIATYIEQPKAVRAVANAIGRNPVPFLIPCHRVIRKLGELGGYGCGVTRKKALIGWEAANSIMN